MLFASITVAGPKSWEHILSNQHPEFHYIFLTETHVHPPGTTEWQKKATCSGLKLPVNHRRTTGQFKKVSSIDPMKGRVAPVPGSAFSTLAGQQLVAATCKWSQVPRWLPS
eukprot:9490484-Pyramimonas_sp.AAC.1